LHNPEAFVGPADLALAMNHFIGRIPLKLLQTA